MCDIVDTMFCHCGSVTLCHTAYISGGIHHIEHQVCNNKRLSHGWQCDMIFIKRVVVRYHERARNERVSDITPTRV